MNLKLKGNSMKKTIFQILSAFFIFLFISQANAQNWVLEQSYPGYELTQICFINANSGWITLSHQGIYVDIKKTVDKGISWSPVFSYTVYGYNPKTFLLFLDVNTGYEAHNNPVGGNTILAKTTNGGYNWSTKVNILNYASSQPLIIFTNSSDGYLFTSEANDPWIVHVYHTTDGFNTYSESYSSGPINHYQYYLTDVFQGNSGSILGIGYNVHGPNYEFNNFLQVYGSGNSFLNSYGTDNSQLRILYGSLINSSNHYVGV